MRCFFVIKNASKSIDFDSLLAFPRVQEHELLGCEYAPKVNEKVEADHEFIHHATVPSDRGSRSTFENRSAAGMSGGGHGRTTRRLTEYGMHSFSFVIIVRVCIDPC